MNRSLDLVTVAYLLGFLASPVLVACDLDLFGPLDSGSGWGGGWSWSGLSVEPGYANLVLGDEPAVSFTAFWTEEGGERSPISASWSVEDTLLATIDADGRAEGRVPGEVSIVARARGEGAFAHAQTVLPEGGSWPGSMRLVSVSSGEDHTCGLDADATVYCWGVNFGGQIAPVTSGSSVYVPLGSDTDPSLVSLASGRAWTCGLTADGSAYCWGMNRSGALGIGMPDSRDRPTRVMTDEPLASLHLGPTHTCALDLGGRAHCWGYNPGGLLGTVDGSADVLSPSPVESDLVFRDLALGDEFTCGISDEGAILCWGRVPMGGGMDLAGPTPVSEGGSFESIGAGFDYVCAVDSDGIPHCFGAQYLLEFSADAPVALETDLRFVPTSLSVGGVDGTACAVTTSEEVYCWGRLPNRDEGVVSSPTPEPGAPGVRVERVSVGGLHACGITLEDDTVCWGSNHGGQLGVGRTDPGSDAPLLVKGQPQT